MVDRYRLLTEVSPDVVVVHQNGRLVYGNRAAVRAGRGRVDRADYLGPAVITDFIHPNDIADTVERIAQLKEHGQFFEHGEARIVLQRRHVNVWRSPASAPPGPVSRPTRSSCGTSPSGGRPRRPTATGPAWWPTSPTPSSVSTPRARSRVGTRRPGPSTDGPRPRWPASPSPPWSPPTARTAPPSSSGVSAATAARTDPRSTCWSPSTP